MGRVGFKGVFCATRAHPASGANQPAYTDRMGARSQNSIQPTNQPAMLASKEQTNKQTNKNTIMGHRFWLIAHHACRMKVYNCNMQQNKGNHQHKYPNIPLLPPSKISKLKNMRYIPCFMKCESKSEWRTSIVNQQANKSDESMKMRNKTSSPTFEDCAFLPARHDHMKNIAQRLWIEIN